MPWMVCGAKKLSKISKIQPKRGEWEPTSSPWGKSATSELGLTFLSGNQSLLALGMCRCWVYPITQNPKNSLIHTKTGGGPHTVLMDKTTPSKRIFLGGKSAIFGMGEAMLRHKMADG